MPARKLICLLVLCAAPAVPVFAQDGGKSSDEWTFLVEPYAWGPNVYVETLDGQEFEISIDDLLDGFDFALELKLGARKDKWTFMFDTIYMDLSWDDFGSANFLGQDIETQVQVDMQVWLLDFTAGYEILQTGKTRLEALAGVQWLYEDLGFKFDVAALGVSTQGTFTAWDGYGGLQGETVLSDKWYLTYQVQLGTGDSNRIWNAIAGANRKFESMTLFMGWRYVDFEMDTSGDDGGQLIDGQYATGPMIGFKWTF